MNLEDAVDDAMRVMWARTEDVERDSMHFAIEAAIEALGLTWAYDSLPVRHDTHVPAPRGAVRWAAKRLVGPWVPDTDTEASISQGLKEAHDGKARRRDDLIDGLA